MAKASKETPMMQQYWKYREEIPEDALLLFRLGDFYEMFHADAEEGARLLGITLTKRSNYPMAGIPYHAKDNYLPKLLAAGKKVAIVDQIETPQPGKLVKRALTQILTPGTLLEENQLDAHKNHYLLALSSTKKGFHAAWLDLSTGDFQLASDTDPRRLLPIFNALDPREIVLPETISPGWAHREDLRDWHEQFDRFCLEHPVTFVPDFQFEGEDGARVVIETLGVHNLNGFGLDKDHPALGAAGALITYATDNLCAPPKNLRRIREYRSGGTLLLDPATMRNLEIFKSAQGTRKGSLLAALDRTVTAAGARLLEQWLAAPILDLEELNRRQLTVKAFIESPGVASQLQESLKQVRDIARILGRLQNRLRNPRELGGVRDTLDQLPAIREFLGKIDEPPVTQLLGSVGAFDELRDFLSASLNDELPGNLTDGGIIRNGFDAELDRLRGLTTDNKTWISDLERDEQEKTGIKNLKVKYNGAFGYFIEITKSNLPNVPEHYIRRQTMVNAERFVTEELRQKEKEIVHAEEKALAREEELFKAVVARILAESDALGSTALALAEIDLFVGWAQLAREWDYCRPTLDEGDQLDIRQGRHPVVEQMLKADLRGFSTTQSFVPNDTRLSASGEQIALITGPNMAGKSTYIRQVSLIALMAQVGCWVPAASCQLGLVDRIFSRVGASDELARGNSTFMVEMNETANILNNATPRSLIILDEIGRGTSTYDGLSIAWSVIEFLHGESEAGPRTLFATHYHEITQLERTLPRLRNYSVSVKEWADEIRFLHTVTEGAADRSYGIQVARLAGLPPKVIDRARTILNELENEGNVLQQTLREPNARPAPKPKRKPAADPVAGDDGAGQLDLF
ncbi:DNA mismatch repair protein MutS [Ruficoccus amylovorans]|uniref:DNA mismatch repair protein MutS n=2 Tax=Ruficoccus amylovorans TaxID=1804625 RepID=A0A842HF03_9BACT|nr:DNA mismatch repair protein MutS [Ruficoccus amylovorans]